MNSDVSFGRDRGNEPKSVWEFRLAGRQTGRTGGARHNKQTETGVTETRQRETRQRESQGEPDSQRQVHNRETDKANGHLHRVPLSLYNECPLEVLRWPATSATRVRFLNGDVLLWLKVGRC